jgi:benzodiazapine receptor
MQSKPIVASPISIWTAAVLAVVPVVATAVLGNMATLPNIPTWYAGLVKPSFNPPNWIFAPIWTTLYAIMAYSFFRVLGTPAAQDLRRAAIVAFFVQLVLNAAWSWAFFAGRSSFGGLIVIAPLWLAIVGTIAAFARIDRPAAWLLSPYLAWVSFASVLNAAIYWLNR